jgi:hypothetical protein
MRKLIESTFVSLDGIIDDTRPSTASRAQPQHWGHPYWDDDHNSYAGKLLSSADAMLLGRVTYEGFAKSLISLREARSGLKMGLVAR